MPIGDKIYNVEINDSEFERIGWQNAPYKGTKLTSAKIILLLMNIIKVYQIK